MKCGAEVEHQCASCNAVNPNVANFCRKCGTALVASVPAAANNAAGAKAPNLEVTPERPAADDLEGERKTVTALFADIKRLDRAPAGPRSRAGARHHRPGSENNDRCGTPLRGANPPSPLMIS